MYLVEIFSLFIAYISYFMYELDYGRDYQDGFIVENGVNIDFSSADKLYDYLIRNKNNE